MTGQGALGIISLADRRVAATSEAPEAHDVGDGFEMSAAECAEFVDTLIRGEDAEPPAGRFDALQRRMLQEVSYHLHWHCANLDGK